MNLRIRTLASALVLSAAAAVPANADYPADQQIHLVVPFGQGGSSSAAARAMVTAIEQNELLPTSFRISYVPGAAGTVGARQVMNAEPDGYSILIWHVAANGAKAMGNVDFGPEAFEPLAGTNRACQMLVVRETSEYHTLADLLQGAADNPETIIAAVNLGGANHISAVLAEASHPGAAFRHVQFGGTAETYPALLGGHAEVNMSTTSALAQTTTEGLRLLGYLGTERHPNFPDVPTFREQGFDVDFCMHAWWFAPKGTPEDRIQILVDAMEEATKTDYMREFAETAGVENVFLRGEELEAVLAQETRDITAIGPRLQGVAN
jgi:putative tricarboxylic transport membrane protein